ncbi:MAG: hypothetical protein ACRYG4_03910 [Janthinobacterium lividum]
MRDCDTILDAYLAAIARHGWIGTRIDAVAVVAGTTAAAVADVFIDRWSALHAFGRRLDRAALAGAEAESGSSVRDRFFAMMMERYDAMQPHKAAVREIWSAARRDPALAVFMLRETQLSIGRIADAAGVRTDGLAGQFRVRVLTIALIDLIPLWLDDESEDMASTMKALDGRLARLEKMATTAIGFH